MTRLHGIVGLLGLLILVTVGLWASSALRRVDGRSAAQWLVLVAQASQSVSYHAVGTTWANGHTARFTLEQGRQGCYAMRVTDAAGNCCNLGFDGRQLWYANNRQDADSVTGDTASAPLHIGGRILGTGVLAGRAVVRLAVQSGTVRKEMAVDRNTGVILAMTTYVAHARVSAMRIERIAYQDVHVARCAVSAAAAMRTATPALVRQVLGHDALRPRWLPGGLAAAGVYVVPCTCCPHGMIALRYSDGASLVTLFEMPGPGCTMGPGCSMAPTGHDVVATRIVNGMSVTAVGTLDAGQMQKMLQSLR